MLDGQNANVLSFARVAKDGTAVVVALNMSAGVQTVALDIQSAGIRQATVRTVMMSPASMKRPDSAGSITLPAFGSWVGAIR